MTMGLDTFVTAMLRALRDRQTSAAELLAMHHAQVARHNPALNVITAPDDDAARAAAAAADAPLLGLPITVKDCIDVAGLPGTAGVSEFAQRRPERDARIVARARAAGAVVIGKTNVPPMAGDWQADNPIYGRTNNP